MTGSAPALVGTSLDPNAATISLMPAALYCDLIEARSLAESVVHSYALSHGPAVSQNERMLWPSRLDPQLITNRSHYKAHKTLKPYMYKGSCERGDE